VELSPVVQVALLQAATQLPFLIVIVVGLWLAIARRKRHPRASLWAGIAFAALVLQIAWRVATSAYVTALVAAGREPASVGGLLATSNVATYVLFLVAVIALTIAVFGSRAPS
jgi:hypothetical protein